MSEASLLIATVSLQKQDPTLYKNFIVTNCFIVKIAIFIPYLDLVHLNNQYIHSIWGASVDSLIVLPLYWVPFAKTFEKCVCQSTQEL